MAPRLENSTDLRLYSPLQLAYIGDSFFELTVRLCILKRHRTSPGRLNHAVTEIVNAGAQADIANYLLPELTEEEKSIYQRGKNAKPATFPKNQTLSDYHRATGLEALIGFLYLSGEKERAQELIHKGIAYLEDRKNEAGSRN